MGASDIVASSLKSRTVRTGIVSDGIRKINGNNDSEGGFLGWVGGLFRLGSTFTGWISTPIKSFLSFSFSAAWGMLVGAATFIYNFNWNATDAELNQSLNAMKSVIAGQLGETLGNVAGFLLCGVAPSAVILRFNQALGLYLLKNVSEELFDEFIANFAVLLKLTFNLGAKAAMVSVFKNTRRAAKEFLRDPNSSQSQIFARLFGRDPIKFNKAVQAWGNPGAKPWSFRQAVDDAIEKLPDGVVENFAENFLEGAFEGCVEGGYVLASGLDNWVLQKRLERETLLGAQKIIEIQPDRTIASEKIILAGGEQLLKAQLPTVIANYQTIEARDIGMWVGEPVSDKIKTAVSPLTLKIFFRGVKTPPWRDSKRTQVEIPNLDRTKIDWDNIKLWAGGASGYMWGRFQAQATLTSGYHAYCWGATPDEAKDRLIALLALSSSTLETIIVHEEVKAGKRLQYSALQKEATLVYPAYFTILNQKKILNEESGYAAISGIYKRKTSRIELWPETKPDNFIEVINELLLVPGANDR